MRPKGSAEALEVRRRLAIRSLQQNKGFRETAKLVGASPGSVSRWWKAFRQGGDDALVAKPPPGNKRKLEAPQLKELEELLLQGPRVHGYKNELWTLLRVAEVIEKHFGVVYVPNYVWYILRRIGWSPQKPERRARERDEEVIGTWRKRDWPRIKKSA